MWQSWKALEVQLDTLILTFFVTGESVQISPTASVDKLHTLLFGGIVRPGGYEGGTGDKSIAINRRRQTTYFCNKEKAINLNSSPSAITYHFSVGPLE